MSHARVGLLFGLGFDTVTEVGLLVVACGAASGIVPIITGLSVAVACLIGGIELISILTEKLDISTGLLGAIGSINLNSVGY